MPLTPVVAAYVLVMGRDSLMALNVDLDNLRAIADIVANGGKDPERQKSANPAIIRYIRNPNPNIQGLAQVQSLLRSSFDINQHFLLSIAPVYDHVALR